MMEATLSKFVAIVFPDEAKAYDGTRALRDLHAEGSLTLYGMAVIAKDPDGRVRVRDAVEPGLLGATVGALVGSMVGVLAGPAGVIVGTAGGTVAGSFFDLFNYGVGHDFISQVSSEIGSGKSAVVAEIAENWTAPLDTRMEALGGFVLRTWRADFEDEQIAAEIAALKADLEQMKAEYAVAAGEAKAMLKSKLEEAKAAMKQTKMRIERRLDALEKQTNAKIAAMERQLSEAHAEQGEKITRRIADVRADYQTRTGKLNKAAALAREALTP